MKLQTTKKWCLFQIDAIGAVICVAFSLAFYLAGVRPLLQHHSARAEARMQYSAQRGESRRLSILLNDLESRRTEARKMLEESPLRLQTVSRANHRIAEMTGLATESGMILKEIQPRRLLAGTRYDVLPIWLSGSGDYPNCVAFLHRLREAFPDTGVISLELTGNPIDPADSGAFQALLEWYIAPTGGTSK